MQRIPTKRSPTRGWARLGSRLAPALAPTLTLALGCGTATSTPGDTEAMDSGAASGTGDEDTTSTPDGTGADATGGAESASSGTTLTTADPDDGDSTGDPDAPPPIDPDAVYVSPQGDDATGDGSYDNPFATIGRGLTAIEPGGLLLVREGTYAEDIDDVPDGSRQFPTTIRAEVDGAAVLVGAGASSDPVVRLDGQYAGIEGFKFLTDSPRPLLALSGQNLHARRNAFGASGAVPVLLVGSDLLFEDNWIWGPAEKGIFAGSSSQCQSGTEPACAYAGIVIRRVVIRLDGVPGDFQGHNGIVLYGARDVSIENVIILDMLEREVLGNYDGGIRSRSGYQSINHRAVGTLVVNTPYRGFITDLMPLDNCVAWDVGAMNFHVEDREQSELSPVTFTTVGGSGMGIAHGATSSALEVPPGSAPSFITEAEAASQGATVVYRYETNEAGEAALTDVPLWPWPYEDRIKSDMRQGTGEDPHRGFAADGTGLYGGPITLTSYIWEYTGTACPPDICG